MSRSLAVIKPDFGARGGFERHLDGLLAGLADRGWKVTVVEVDGRTRPERLWGFPIGRPQLESHDEYFLHMALIERVRQLDLSHFDAVLTTQPPTYLADHPHKVALFYHHGRQFYDLAGVFARSGFVDGDLHAGAVAAVRGVESDAVADVTTWLAGSLEVAARLREFWAIPGGRIEIHAAPPTSIPTAIAPYNAAGPIVAVGRHEWPKRVELLVQAAHLMTSERPLVLVGDGSRLGFARSLDAELGAAPRKATDLAEEATWQNRGIFTSGWKPFGGPESGKIGFVVDADDAARDRTYDDASMVVAPAFREDYGLTAIEAMVRARPVIVCRDGGGLADQIDDGETGLIVEPSAKAIAAGIDRLIAEPDLARRMGEAGREAVANITIEAAADQVDRALRDCVR